MAALLLIGWIACIIYSTIPAFWLAIHPRVEYWRAWRYSPYVLLVPMWVGMWIALGLVTARWRNVTLYSAPWTWAPAVLLLALGLWIYSRAGVRFSAAQLGGLPELLPGRHEQLLITTGIRARVRHPVYLGHLCEMLAWSVGTGLAVCYVLSAFAVFTGTIMVRLEDEELERRFGEEYAQYRDRVPAVLPTVHI